MEKKPYGKTTDGKSVDSYTLTNTKGASADILSYGGIVTHLMVPDKDGKLGDVVLGFDNLAGYEKTARISAQSWAESPTVSQREPTKWMAMNITARSTIRPIHCTAD